MKHITSAEKLQLALNKLGEPLSQYDSWSEDGRPLSDITARTRYFERLPKALFECSCTERHHMIAPKKISANVGVDNGDIVLRGEFRFDVLIYRHYYKSSFFSSKEYFLVKCKGDVVSLVSTSNSNRAKGRVEFTVKSSCLSSSYSSFGFLVKT